MILDMPREAKDTRRLSGKSIFPLFSVFWEHFENSSTVDFTVSGDGFRIIFHCFFLRFAPVRRVLCVCLCARCVNLVLKYLARLQASRRQRRSSAGYAAPCFTSSSPYGDRHFQALDQAAERPPANTATGLLIRNICQRE